LSGIFQVRNISSNLQEYGTERQKENIRMEIANVCAEQLQRENQNLSYQCEECLYIEEEFSTPPAICEVYIIPNIVYC
jgi:peptide subunit release factor 1 (eRF1)